MVNSERVKIWNSFFHQAWAEALRLKKDEPVVGGFNPLGGRLSDEDQSILTIISLCTLAIEARANHLILELVEDGKLTEELGDAALHLRPRQRWILLPKLAGKKKRINIHKPPHQAISEICGLRNTIIHVKYKEFPKKLPNKGKTLSLFNGFIIAMEDMHMIMRGGRKHRITVTSLANL